MVSLLQTQQNCYNQTHLPPKLHFIRNFLSVHHFSIGMPLLRVYPASTVTPKSSCGGVKTSIELSRVVGGQKSKAALLDLTDSLTRSSETPLKCYLEL